MLILILNLKCTCECLAKKRHVQILLIYYRYIYLAHYWFPLSPEWTLTGKIFSEISDKQEIIEILIIMRIFCVIHVIISVARKHVIFCALKIFHFRQRKAHESETAGSKWAQIKYKRTEGTLTGIRHFVWIIKFELSMFVESDKGQKAGLQGHKIKYSPWCETCSWFVGKAKYNVTYHCYRFSPLF